MAATGTSTSHFSHNTQMGAVSGLNGNTVVPIKVSSDGTILTGSTGGSSSTATETTLALVSKRAFDTNNSTSSITSLAHGESWTGTLTAINDGYMGLIATISTTSLSSVGTFSFAVVETMGVATRTTTFSSETKGFSTLRVYCPFCASSPSSYRLSFASVNSTNGSNSFAALSVRSTYHNKPVSQGIDYDIVIGQNTYDVNIAAILSNDLNARLFLQSNSDSGPYDSYITFPIPTSNAKVRIVSTSANDTSAGTGARTVLITGVDSSFNPVSIVLTMNGITAVTSVSDIMVFVNTVEVLTSGAAASPVGRLEVYLEIAAVFTIVQMSEIRNGLMFNSRMLYCVPNGAIVDVTHLSIQGSTDGLAYLFKLPRGNRTAAQCLKTSLSTRNRELIAPGDAVTVSGGDIVGVVVESSSSEGFYGNMTLKQKSQCVFADT